MNLRRVLLIGLSAALAIFLIFVLVRISKIDLRVTLQLLQGVSVFSIAKLFLLNLLLVYFSSEKWRSVDAVWRHHSDSVPSQTASFALTAAGFALGLFLPVQIAMSAVRTLGTYAHGRPLQRGTAGTLLEQGFDLLLVTFLGLASLAVRFFHGAGLMWMAFAAIACTFAFLAVRPAIHMIRWLAAKCASRNAENQNRLLKALGELRHSGVLNTGLARRLLLLSLGRYGVVVLMSTETAGAIGEHISIWQMAAAIPFVVIASVIALTPGGLGVNELASVGALKLFGTPLAVAGQWAIANRVLVAVSYILVAILAMLALYGERWMGLRERVAVRNH
jgi:uncharacterized protein (TIRG00374 family)